MPADTVKPLDPEHQAEVPKKRRRKASTNGAGEDCASCRKQQKYCDRKRPYCGACVEQGKECPGYKTVLTWGVGVASRGKLRGMSLPIPVPKKPVSGSTQSTTPVESKSRATTQARSKRNRSISIKSEATSQDNSKPYPNVQAQMPGFKHENSWQLPPPQPSTVRPSAPSRTSSINNPLPPFLTHVLNPVMPEDMNQAAYRNSMATSPESVRAPSDYGSYAGRHMSGDSSLTDDYFPQHQYARSYQMSTFETSAAREDPIGEGAPIMPSTMMLDPRLSNAEYVVPMGDSVYTGSTDNTQSVIDPAFDVVETRSPDDFSPTDSSSNQESSGGTMDTEEAETVELPRGEAVDSKQGYLANLTSPQVGLALYNIAPRMRFLMDYYDKYICPVVVAFDGTTASPNPYRTYILNLATENYGLQHAIGALALNNMRMKQAGVLPRFLAATSGDDIDAIDDTQIVPAATAEENGYKAYSIRHLNQQLVSTVSARDDAVLATLLVLCLFHVSDSGFSKFKVQLAGVQKLLMLRGQMMHTEFISWVEIFFAWFDAMTSAVNDREVEISGEYIDLNTIGNNLGTPEQYSGCEGRLFKLISRLGRLNLLAQEKPVSAMVPRAGTQSNFLNFNSFTNGGSYSMDFDGMSDDGENAEAPDPDHRAEFWREWRDIRQSLAQWEMEHMHAPFMISMESLPIPQRDLLNISECFRLAALLYTERLAHPGLPSSVDNFQGIVAQALFHIAQLSENSCVIKFMLWPLFIIGTECVDDMHRQVIRDKIIEIYNESGFYNNLASLRVLLKIWKENAAGTEAPPMIQGQAFRWRHAMHRNDGEYIII